MIEDFITNTNNFDSKQIDHEPLSNTKQWLNIFNNKINQPFHKFWFRILNVKFMNEFQNWKTIRFAVNNKSTEVKRLLKFFSNMMEYLKKIIEEFFPNVIFDCPWKESDNYPHIFSFFNSSEIIFVDTFEKNFIVEELNKNLSYSILFEISNLKIMKIYIDSDKITHTVKFNLGLKMVQLEPTFNLKSCLLGKIIHQHEEISEDNVSDKKNLRKQLPFLLELSGGRNESKINLNKNNSNLNTNTNSSSFKSNDINLNELLSIKNGLKKVDIDEKGLKLNQMHQILADHKNGLKKVETFEKSFYVVGNELIEKNEKVEKIKKKKSKKNKKSTENIAIDTYQNDLEKELEMCQ